MGYQKKLRHKKESEYEKETTNNKQNGVINRDEGREKKSKRKKVE